MWMMQKHCFKKHSSAIKRLFVLYLPSMVIIWSGLVCLSITGISQATEPIEVVIPTQNSYSIGTLAFHPSGRFLVTACSVDGGLPLILWDMETGIAIHQYSGPSRLYGVTGVAFSPDGKRLATGNDGGYMSLIDISSDTTVLKWKRLPSGVSAIAFSPNGELLASGCWDGTIRLWDSATGDSLFTLAGHTDRVSAIVFSPDGRIFASGGEDGTIGLWETTAGRKIGTLRKDSPWSVTSLSFSSDGRILASGGWLGRLAFTEENSPKGYGQLKFTGKVDGVVDLWDIESRTIIHTITGFGNKVTSVSFRPNSQILAISSLDGTIKLWDTVTNVRIDGGSLYGMGSCTFSPDGSLLACAGWGRGIWIWDVNTQRLHRALKGQTHGITGLSFSPNSSTLASHSEDGLIRLWNTVPDSGMRLLNRVHTHGSALAYSPDGKWLASGGMDRSINLSDAVLTTPVKTLVGQSDSVASIVFSPNGKLLACGSGTSDGRITIWDISKRAIIQSLSGDSNAVGLLSFSPDGRFLASACGLGGWEYKIQLWDVRTGAVIRVFDDIPFIPLALDFSPNGRFLASGGNRDTLRVWSMPSGKIYTNLIVGDATRSIAFSPNSRLLAAGDDYGVIHLFETETRREVKQFNTTGPKGTFLLSFSPSGRLLASAGQDGAIYLWDVERGVLQGTLIAIGEQDWIVSTPDGRFDASPGVMDLPHWIIGLEPISPRQLSEDYYRPGLLSNLLDAVPDTSHPVHPLTSNMLFPKITVQQSAEQDTVLTVTLANQGGGIGPVQVFAGEQEWLADARPSGFDHQAKETVLHIPLRNAPLRPASARTLRIMAWNTDKTMGSRSVTVVLPLSR